ncbi:MAG: cephalosporin hydroxylase family protein [Actinomycetota bacterium]|nr:cephalosporin hydroxylase family protein [Actinomycetota bacterium]
MRIVLDTDAKTLTYDQGNEPRTVDLYSADAFHFLTDAWVKVGWEVKYPYLFTWLGRPIIQLPDDLLVIHEVLYRCRPDVIIETGVAHGGSLVFYASLCEAVKHGRIVGVDIEIRPHNRAAIESHELAHRISLIEGSSVSPEVVGQVQGLVHADERVFVILDSNHSKDHVLAELEAYAPLVTTDSYIVVTDGVMEMVQDVPRGSPEWLTDNPKAAALEFLEMHPEFELEDPMLPIFNEAGTVRRATHWPCAYLRRRG